MSNYRLSRDRVKGYTSRPLIDDVIRRDNKVVQKPTIVAKNPNGPYTHTIQNKPKTQSVTPKPVRRVVSRERYLNKKTILYCLTIVLVVAAIATNIVVFRQSGSAVIGAQAINTAAGNPDDNSQTTATTDSIAAIDESEPPTDTIRDYAVAKTLPRFIDIDAIGVYARVIRVGISSTNEILTPKNIFNVGWYEGSAKPNEPGALFINGHVSGPTKRGVFYNLKKLNVGDVIKLETGDANLYHYKVVEKEIVDVSQVNMNKVLRSHDSDKQGLNIMTCGGNFDNNSHSYQQRVIVYAVRI